MRLFFAIDIPIDIKSRIATVQDELRASIPDGYLRFVSPDLLHVTLSFLGEVAADRLQEVIARAQSITSACAPTKINFQGIGCFPAWRSPQVLWVGVDEDGAPPTSFKGPMTNLGNDLSRACSSLGSAEPESSTLLHVTIARSNTKMTPDRAKAVAAPVAAQSWTDLGESKVSEILLFESTLGKGPTRHDVVARFPFKA